MTCEMLPVLRGPQPYALEGSGSRRGSAARCPWGNGQRCARGGERECRLSAALACWNRAVTCWKLTHLGLNGTTSGADTSSRSGLVNTL